MFYILSKLAGFLLLPSGILMILWLTVLLIKNRTKAKRLGLFTLLLTYLLMCPAAVLLTAGNLEYNETTLKPDDTFAVGVVLTGNMITPDVKYPENLHLKGSGDRLWQALRLYQNGQIENILISGGDIGLINKSKLLEIDIARNYLIANGVPKEHILTDRKSRNTYENALFSKEIIEKRFQEEPILLITSAFHMKRALGCFRKQGIEATPFPADFIGAQRKPDIIEFTPNSGALATTELFWKERIGLWVYKLKGYL